MKAIKYTRFSSDGQSSFSIERQDMIIDNWIASNKIELVDSFTDEGYTARNFDRPDVKKLFSFIQKNKQRVDYLIVAELTRFSREAGDAINMVKEIQQSSGIRIVSASRSTIYDVYDSNSYFMLGLEFLLGNSENIKRQNDINGGIYTAKAEKGRWIQGGPAPYGFRKEGTGDARRLVQVEAQAIIIQFIFSSFLSGTPIYIIRQEAKKMGFTKSGNDAIHEILRNPLYMGYQFVKPWKNHPGGLFPLNNFQPIIDIQTFNQVQNKFAAPKARTTIAEDFPLRGIVNCFCGRPLTGAPSRGRSGKLYGFYKCNTARHLNISSGTMHEQLQGILANLCIPDRIINAVAIAGEKILEEKLSQNRAIAADLTNQLQQVEAKLKSVEEKFINNQMNFETYNRWHSELSMKASAFRQQITNLSKNEEQVKLITAANLSRLNNLQQIYNISDVITKQQLLKRVFDSRLYYKTDRYRTPYIMPIFAHNLQILSEKQLLEFDGIWSKSPDVEATGFLSNNIISFLEFISLLKIA